MGILWILLSDNLLLLLFHKTAPGYIRQIQTYKGIFYVLITGVLLYYLIRHSYNQLRSKLEELTELNQNLAAQKRQLELSNKELEQFSYIVSHDLQEPLRMISSFATRISEKYDDRLDQRGKQYCWCCGWRWWVERRTRGHGSNRSFDGPTFWPASHGSDCCISSI